MTGRATLLVLCVLLAGPAAAGNVYRCEGGDGITTYANKRVPGARCKLVGSYQAKRSPAPSIAQHDLVAVMGAQGLGEQGAGRVAVPAGADMLEIAAGAVHVGVVAGDRRA